MCTTELLNKFKNLVLKCWIVTSILLAYFEKQIIIDLQWYNRFIIIIFLRYNLYILNGGHCKKPLNRIFESVLMRCKYPLIKLLMFKDMEIAIESFDILCKYNYLIIIVLRVQVNLIVVYKEIWWFMCWCNVN